MILGSHNSLSYAKPTKWWMRLLRFTAKCQSLDIHNQIELGVRYFDIRVRYDKKTDSFVPAHGPITFDCSIDEALLEIDDIFGHARVVLEQNAPKKNQEEIDNKFIDFCKEIDGRYPHIKFQYGVRKYDWKRLYTFFIEDKDILDIANKYSSTTGLFWKKTGTFIDKIDDLWPWLYAKLHNKDVFVELINEDVLLIDFIELAIPCNNKKISIDVQTKHALDLIGADLFG